ncbi:MutS-related protein [Candidatus Cardinium hertigii]|nr:hypothetical protein [Candidatus Cardinium hertigii]
MGNNLVFARRLTYDDNIAIKISRNYLKSFPITHTPVMAVPLSPTSTKQKQQMVLPSVEVNLAESTQRKILLRTIFSDITPYVLETDVELLNNNAWTDLILFCGADSHPAHHLLSRINRTATVVGECALATLLVTPTSDIATLANRQQTVQWLLAHPACLTDLKQSLEAYHNVEQRLLSFWTHTDPLATKEYQAYMNRRFLSDNPAVNKIERKLNTRIFVRNFRDIYGEFIALPIFVILSCELHYLMTAFAKGGFFRSSTSRDSSYEMAPFFIPGWSIKKAISHYRDAKNPSLLPFAGVAITHGLAVWRGYCGVKQYQEYSTVFRNLANRMQDVQLFMKTIQQVSNIVASHHELEALYGPSLQEIRALLAHSKEQTEIGIMVRNFLNMKFDNWSYIRGNGGKLLATYNLFEEHKNCLKPAMYALGRLDSFMGIATLMEEASETCPKHCYTFTKFLDRSTQTTPSIQFNGMWNPLLDPTVAIDNEVEMDAHKTRNIVLCGPNAGGKSSFLSAVAMSLLLSQTFGIAPAKHAIITPFNKINTYIEVEDDIARGASLFMVEIERMQRYVNMLEKAKPDQFIFAVADEPFAGTNPAEAGAIAYSFVAAMAQYPNALHIVASHYPILLGLEDKAPGRGIRNFKVFVQEGIDKKLHYTYKVVPGAGTQTVALKLLERAGYDQKLLKEAEYITKHPEKFHKGFRKVL